MNRTRINRDIKRKFQVVLITPNHLIMTEDFADYNEALNYAKTLKARYKAYNITWWEVCLRIKTFTHNDMEALHTKEYRFTPKRRYAEYLVFNGCIKDNIYYHIYHN